MGAATGGRGGGRVRRILVLIAFICTRTRRREASGAPQRCLFPTGLTNPRQARDVQARPATYGRIKLSIIEGLICVWTTVVAPIAKSLTCRACCGRRGMVALSCLNNTVRSRICSHGPCGGMHRPFCALWLDWPELACPRPFRCRESCCGHYEASASLLCPVRLVQQPAEGAV